MLFLRQFIPFICLLLALSLCHAESEPLPVGEDLNPQRLRTTENLKILRSLAKLQQNLREQIESSQNKLAASTSESEKQSLKNELEQLDKQLNDAKNDFARIATGVEATVFIDTKPEAFSWRDEFAILIEPAVKELKRLTIRARQKTKLKDSISKYANLSEISDDAVEHLNNLISQAEDSTIKDKLNNLLPELLRIQSRLKNKLELAELELDELEAQEVSFVESSSRSMQTFFRERGLYLLIAVTTFGGILVLFSLLFRLLTAFSPKSKEKAFHVRFLSLAYRVCSIAAAVFGFFLVLYLAEDWFLLSLAIIFCFAFIMALRQGIPKLWHQGRLMLNVGAVREGERVIINNIPWKVDELNVFTILSNPSLKAKLRIPIENMIGLTSRAYTSDEPWFPCMKGDWVVIDDNPRARVVSLSPDVVELVERGGTRVFYNTSDFLGLSPSNLSRNFRLRVPFGIAYKHQEQATEEIPDLLKEFIEKRLEEAGYGEDYLKLLVEFMQANDSSLDMMILADFKGEVADIQARLKRFLNRCCVEACTKYNWEIPYPHISLQLPDKNIKNQQGL